MNTVRKMVIAIVVLLLLSIVTIGGLVGSALSSRRSPVAAEVEIAAGASMRSIALSLAAQQVIASPKLFEMIARAKGLNRRLRAGTYVFPAGMRLSEVMHKIARGDVKQYPFAVIEGWNVKDIAAALAGQPFLADPTVPEQFLALARDPQVATEMGFAGFPSLEGLLFPDTYLFVKSVTARDFIRRLVTRFQEVWASLDQQAVAVSGLSQRDIVTLASIVEKETGAASERPIIASVFFNRLKLEMPLQSDPTIIYGLPNYDGNIRRDDIHNPHPYNTYVHAGLPPGPICSPGKAALDAVLHPVESDYLYFVARGDGTHHFSASLTEHNQAVMQYQIAPARAQREGTLLR